MRRFGADRRRARLAWRQRLAPVARASDPVEAARSLVGFHATDPTSVYLQARARVPGFERAALADALYVDRALVRLLGMRRTLFVVPPDLAAVIQAACARDIADRERRRLLTMLEDVRFAGDARRWLEDAEAATLRSLGARGEATATELRRDVAALRERVAFGAGRSWAGTFGMSTRVLVLLALEGRIVRAEPRGSWISSQYRWAPTERWLGGSIDGLPTDEARTELVRAWLATYGPGTVEDVRWWTGWSLRETNRVLERLDTEPVDLDGGPGLLLRDDEDDHAAADPWLAFLPALDPAVMGWKAREWYLGPHAIALFDRNGNAGPTIWADGRVVGGWGQRDDGSVAFRLLEDVGREMALAAEREAADLEAWLEGWRITPRFRTPLELELRS